MTDLYLWQHSFLKRASDCIWLNGIVLRNLTKVIISDSCPYGLGGMTTNGRAWRLFIPPYAPFYGKDEVNNVLEFLGIAITLRLELNELLEKGESQEVILALADNSSAVHWLFKSGKLEKGSLYFKATNFIARSVAKWMMNSENFLCSQHIKGEYNHISDLLSFKGEV